MYELKNILFPIFVVILTLFLLHLFTKTSKTTKSNPNPNPSKSHTLPKPYPIIGHLLAFSGLTGQEILEWLSKIIAFSSPTSTVIHTPMGGQSIYTGNPTNVQHILKTRFTNYPKGSKVKSVFRDVFGDSIFTEDGDIWTFQRNILAHVFTHKALIKFVEKTVHFEVTERLIPVLLDAAKNNKVIDLQDIFKRFTFDNVCISSFGYDPGYLTLPLPDAKFSKAFDECITICHARFYSIFPINWKICRLLNIGSEKRLKDLVSIVREFSRSMIESAKIKRSIEEDDLAKESNLLAKLLECDQLDEEAVRDLVISFILAGRDTSSIGLTWFFWLIHKNKHVEIEVVNEITTYAEKTKQHNSFSDSSSSNILEALKNMTYTHAALSETLRLYPPVPIEIKQAATDDILPDGTKVKKGSIVGYYAQAMGWSEKLWGSNWAQFLPERWLKEDLDPRTEEKIRKFVPRDPYSYPVFLAGPRICLGKEMAYLQMKSVVATVLSRFKVIPAVQEGFHPVYFIETAASMHGGFPVRIEERDSVD